MNLLTTIRELFQHMEWADALVWQTVAVSDAALEDEDLRARLLHIHTVQRAFLRIWQERPLNPNVGNDLGGAALAAWGQEYHQEVAQYLSEMAEADLDRPVTLPWAEFIAARIGRQPETPTSARPCCRSLRTAGTTADRSTCACGNWARNRRSWTSSHGSGLESLRRSGRYRSRPTLFNENGVF